MEKVFVSGSLRIKHLDKKVVERLNNIISKKMQVIVGDADGVDSSIQHYLKDKEINAVVVYCSGERARNNLGFWTTHNIKTGYKIGSREFFTAKDKEMARDCDYGFMVWDAKSTGTLNNVIELLNYKKKSVVYINKVKEFISIKNVDDLQNLFRFMEPSSFKDADEKIGLRKKLNELKHVQNDMFVTD